MTQSNGRSHSPLPHRRIVDEWHIKQSRLKRNDLPRRFPKGLRNQAKQANKEADHIVEFQLILVALEKIQILNCNGDNIRVKYYKADSIKDLMKIFNSQGNFQMLTHTENLRKAKIIKKFRKNYYQCNKYANFLICLKPFYNRPLTKF